MSEWIPFSLHSGSISNSSDSIHYLSCRNFHSVATHSIQYNLLALPFRAEKLISLWFLIALQPLLVYQFLPCEGHLSQEESLSIFGTWAFAQNKRRQSLEGRTAALRVHIASRLKTPSSSRNIKKRGDDDDDVERETN